MSTSVTPTALLAWPDGDLDPRRVTRCALGRVCGGCGRSLGRPIAFVGPVDEVGGNAFRAPPLHAACADDVRRQVGPTWDVVLTAGYEFVRPARSDLDRRPRFEPNSLL